MKLAQRCSSLEGYQGPVYREFAGRNVPQLSKKKRSKPEAVHLPEKEAENQGAAQQQVTAVDSMDL